MGTMEKAKTSGADISLQPPSITTSHHERETKTLETTFDRSQLKSDRFNIWNTIGVQFSVGAAPLSTGIYLSLVVATGGRPYFFWSSLVALIGQFQIMLSLAEIASAYPHTAGPPYWVSVLSPRKSVGFLSYWSGISTCFGWLFALAASTIFCSQFLFSLGTLTTGHTATVWQLYLGVLALLAVGLCLNTLAVRAFSHLTSFFLFFINAAAIFLVISLLVTSNPKAGASEVFLDPVDMTGWGSDGLVFLLAIVPGVSVVSYFDTASHMAEELPRPDKQVPKVMIITNILNAISMLLMVVVLSFCITQPENLLAPMAGLPILQLCWDAFPSQAYVLTVAICYILTQTFACSSIVYTLSRLLWSFSKSRGVPFHGWLSATNGRLQVPVNAVVASSLLCAVVTLLVLGPRTVQNAFFGSAGIFFIFSYTMPIILLLVQGRKTLPENRPVNLGAFGPFINVVALLWALVVVVFISFPTSWPIELTTMNWGSLTAVGLMVLSLGNWFWKRNSYILLHGLYIDKESGDTDA